MSLGGRDEDGRMDNDGHESMPGQAATGGRADGAAAAAMTQTRKNRFGTGEAVPRSKIDSPRGSAAPTTRVAAGSGNLEL